MFRLNLYMTDKKIRCERTKGFIAFGFCLLSAFLVLMVCSKCSFLYPINDWVDSNCFLTVGKSMLGGKILYRDIYEQKGPIIYFIHMLASLVSKKSFIGVFIFEVLAGGVCLFGFYKILTIYCSVLSITIIPVIALTLYTACSFSGGDSAEEFCMPIIVWSIYLSLKAAKNKILLSRGNFIFIGAAIAFILMTKYTMLGFFIGWVIFNIIIGIFDRRPYEIGKMIIWTFIGAIIIILPILTYFMLSGAISNLIQVYFIDNITIYSPFNGSDIVSHLSRRVSELVNNISGAFFSNLLFMVPALLGLLWGLIQKNKRVTLLIVLTEIFSLYFTYIGNRTYLYYAFILASFSCFGWIIIQLLLDRIWLSSFTIKVENRSSVRKIRLCMSFAAILFISVLGSYFLSGNTYLMNYKKDDLPQYKFAKEISIEKGASLSNYGFLDGGFYTASGITPKDKYFCKLNIPKLDMIISQTEDIKSGMVDYIVTRGERLPLELSKRYSCVDTAVFPYKDGGLFNSSERIYRYYLYKLKNIG